VQVHYQVLRLGIPVADLTLVAVGVPSHLFGHIAILLVLLQQLVVLVLHLRTGLQRLAEDHRGSARPRDGRWSRDGAVPWDERVVLYASHRVGWVEVVVMDTRSLLRLALILRLLLGHQLGGDVFVPLHVLALLEHRQVRVAVHAEPVLSVVDGNQIGDKRFVRLPDVAAFALLGTKDHVVVEGVVHDGKAEVLQVDSNLVHTSCERPADDDTRDSVVAQTLKLCSALFAVCGHLAHSDLVADHLDRLTALGLSLRELTLHPADVFLQHLPIPDLLLHLASLPWVPPEHQQPRCESVQTVDRSQVLQTELLGEDEDDRVVPVSPARMDLFQPGRLQGLSRTTSSSER